MKMLLASFADVFAARCTTTLAFVGLILATLGVSDACAQANLTFSGGNGSPLKLTLSAPVTYTVTTAGDENNAPYFVLQGLGNAINSEYSLSGTISFTINGGVAQALPFLNPGVTVGSLAATDIFLSGPAPGVTVGSTVRLNAGTLTTTSNFAGAPPTAGSYQTFLIEGDGTKLDAVNGVAGPVPEPSTWTLLVLGAGLSLVTLRQYRARLA